MPLKVNSTIHNKCEIPAFSVVLIKETELISNRQMNLFSALKCFDKTLTRMKMTKDFFVDPVVFAVIHHLIHCFINQTFYVPVCEKSYAFTADYTSYYESDTHHSKRFFLPQQN